MVVLAILYNLLGLQRLVALARAAVVAVLELRLMAAQVEQVVDMAQVVAAVALEIVMQAVWVATEAREALAL